MMQRMFGPFPRSMQKGQSASSYFRADERLDYPNDNTLYKSECRVARLRPLKVRP